MINQILYFLVDILTAFFEDSRSYLNAGGKHNSILFYNNLHIIYHYNFLAIIVLYYYIMDSVWNVH